MKKSLIIATLLISVTAIAQTQTNQVGTSGKVGVNTTNPDKELEVVGETKLDGNTEITSNLQLNGDLKIQSLANPSCTDESFLSICSTGKVSSFSSESLQQILYSVKPPCLDPSGNAVIYLPPVWNNATGPNPNLGDRKLYTGVECPAWVGIGTDSPQAEIDVRGSGRFGNNPNTGTILIKSEGNKGVIESENGDLFLNKYSGNDVQVGTTSNNAMFHVNGNTHLHGLTEAEDIEADGDVEVTGSLSIGTSIQSGYSLAVCGKIGSREVKVEAYNGWCDYVFEDDYKLSTLEEVSEFIKENKHLPEIPSAKEVEEKGINVSEMMTLMMKKIEELTLYTIEQEKEIKQLNELIQK